MRPNNTNFRYLNRQGAWLDFHWDGLELLEDGGLQLISLPRLGTPVPAAVSALPMPAAPAGIAFGPDGSLYYTDPDKNRVYRIDGCFGQMAPVPCIGGKGTGVTGLDKPRGLLVMEPRNALLVADSGNHRVQIFDLDSWELLDSLSTGLDEPWALAADSEGSVYVADHGSRAVVKFSVSGDPVPGFWQNVNVSTPITQPGGVAVWSTSVYILDLDSKKIFEFDFDGKPVLDGSGAPVVAAWPGFQQPMGLAADAGHLWAGDNGSGTVAQFNLKSGQFLFAGQAVGYQGPVAALALDGKGGLWVAGGGAPAPVVLTIGAGYGAKGALWSAPISIEGPSPSWHRLQALVQFAGTESHVQLFLRTADALMPAPSIDLLANPPFAAPDWRSVPYDVTDSFIGGPPQKYLWVAAELTGDRKSTPVISQMRAEYNHQSYLDYLPEIYREAPPGNDFLLRFVSLFESFFDEPEAAIEGLPLLFDPQAAQASVLPWLETWLALDLPEDLEESARRKAIAGAFQTYALRGTPLGLQQAVLASTGVNTVIEEPILSAGWWRLPGPSTSCNASPGSPQWEDGANSVLGFTTGLACAAPQGAVAGITSVLDQSHLITDEQLGAPLFEAVAYQFSVLVYPSDIGCRGKLAQVQAAIESEKPAHTAYHLCVIQPQMRVGFQARLGIDTVVSGPPLPTPLGDPDAMGGLVLAGDPAGIIGMSHVGEDTRL